jgi:hypothetical protein
MRRAWRVTELVAIPTIGLGIALALAPRKAELEARAWLLVLLGLALFAFTGIVRAAYPTRPSPFAASLRRSRAPAERLGALMRLEREVSMAGSAAFDVHYRLRPSLVVLASGLLASRRGIDLAREPDRARAALGEEAWEIVRPDRPPPTRRLGAGIGEAHLERVVSALERI